MKTTIAESGERGTFIRRESLLDECPDELTRQLADHIHASTCHSSHTDRCGYFYETWEDVRYHGEERKRLYLRAATIIKRFGVAAVRQYLHIRDEVVRLDRR